MELGSVNAPFLIKETVMLRKTIYGTVAAVSLLAVSASTADAQFASPIRFNINAGASVPVGTLSDDIADDGGGAELGFNLGAGLELRAPLMPVGLRFDGAYDRLGIEDFDAAWSIWSLTANAVLSPMASPLYFIGGVGFFGSRPTGGGIRAGGGNDIGFQPRAGLVLPLAGFRAVIRGGGPYIHTSGGGHPL